MTHHEFGGSWTEEKLERLRKYLRAYTTIFKGNEGARFFTTVYVDAFAGSGQRVDSGSELDASDTLLGSADSDAQSFKKGSAQIALEVDPTFDCFIFIEKDAGRAGELQALRRQFPNRTAAIRIEQDDANTFLESWCRQAGFWKNHRAVVLLDPYGMQVDWKTVEAIAATRAIDLWYLFPLGVAVNRLLTQTSPPPEKWANALTRILGTPDWQEVFYPRQEVTTLFGSEESQSKAVTLDNVGEFFVNRLKTIFAKVAENPLQLRNSRGNPIYLLCFAAGNPKGATTAVKIAQDILGLQAGC